MTTAVRAFDSTDNAAVDEESPVVGVPNLEGVQRAFRNGFGIRWVMDAWGLDYATAKAIRHELINAAEGD